MVGLSSVNYSRDKYDPFKRDSETVQQAMLVKLSPFKLLVHTLNSVDAQKIFIFS